ncbi:PREDICTED: submaxillary mucin-like protein, partial [Hipposideros armiger]|uniref:Submaxillary mucin-like protein n=1 Tax=Hipposideros armiger TaxID=186990 RepID=A0A8B7QNQ7_HIPAR
ATTGTAEKPSPGSKTGTSGVVSGTTIASGSSNTGATTSLESGGTTEGGIKIVTLGVTPGTTIAPRSSNTKATTSIEIGATTGVGMATGVTNIIPGIQSTGSKTGITEIASGTTVISESANTGATTGVGMQTSTSVISSEITGFPERSSPGNFKEASETTTAPRISTTGNTSVSNGIKTSLKVFFPETIIVTTGDQETENKTGCPASLPPPPVCHGPLGEEKSPGDIWTANCHRCTCTNANSVDCKPKECPSPPTCKDGERLVKFKANDTCCEIGHCEPRTCLFNNTNHEIGTSFGDSNNPCITYSCQNTGFIAVVQDCPKQTWCAEKDRVYDSRKCCYTCNTNCRSSLVNVTVKYNGCKKKVEMARCTGECKNTIKYNYDIYQLENSCLCCREENYEFREITLDCPDGSTIPYRYRHITVCSCLDKCRNSMSSARSES